jgi:hypothetical protein
MQTAGVSDGGSPINGASGSQVDNTVTSAVAGTFDPLPRLLSIYRPRRDERLGWPEPMRVRTSLKDVTHCVPLRLLSAIANSYSSGSGGADTVYGLRRSGNQGERGTGLSNLSSEFIREVRSNDAGSLFMPPPVFATESVEASRLAGQAR